MTAIDPDTLIDDTTFADLGLAQPLLAALSDAMRLVGLEPVAVTSLLRHIPGAIAAAGAMDAVEESSSGSPVAAASPSTRSSRI